MSGSRGSKEINDLVVETLPELLQRYEVIHQSGIEDYEHLRRQLQGMNVPFLDDYHLFPFLKSKLANAYAACDLVVSRAGANTVAEIMLWASPVYWCRWCRMRRTNCAMRSSSPRRARP